MVNPKICSVPDCDNIAIKRQWCSKHYQRWRTYGDPNHSVRTPPGAVREWIDEHLCYDAEDCLIWPFTRKSDGTPHMNFGGGKFGNAARFMCIQVNGEPPSIYHEAALLCGPASNGCVHPKHVFWKEPIPWIFEPRVVGNQLCCGVDGCNNQFYRLGVCGPHYKRYYRYGDPLGGGTYRGSVAEWLNAHVDYQGEDCLIWPFAKEAKGYPICDKNLGSGIASNVMCRMAHGEPPTPEHQAAHSCGKGHEGCINPNHLSWKTPAENQADRLEHGTMIRGEQCWKAILTEGDVRDIRGSTLPDEVLAEKYHVVPRTIYQVRSRINWDWLD